MTILACASISFLSAQTSGASPFFNAAGDTRYASEIDSSNANDTAQSAAPSVPLGYPVPSKKSDATPAEPSAGKEQLLSNKNLESKKAFISYSASTKTLTLVIPRSQNVSVSAHVLSGQTISRFSTRKFLTEGAHTVRLGNAALAMGVIVFRVEGEGFSLVKRINVAEER
jgi:hypothetical protein